MGIPTVRHAGEAFLDEAVELIVAHAQQAIAENGQFRLSLCGGGTPRPIYQRLGQLQDGEIDWSRTILTFGDERSVGPEHEDSNFRMVREALLDHISIPDENVIRIEAEHGAEEAAGRCTQRLRDLGGEDGAFMHDLVLLGLGDDGHTASLFPDSDALDIEEAAVVKNHVAKFATDRITFTYPLINAAKSVCFLVTGEEKKGAVVERILAGGSDDPAARIDPQGTLTWLLDW